MSMPKSNGGKSGGKPDVKSQPTLPLKIAAPDEVYPEVEVGRGLTVQLCWITPEMATRFLANRGKGQRNSRYWHLKTLTSDVQGGRFKLNGETIIFDVDGRLIDGQHRLQAVVESGVPILTLVVRNVEPDVYPSIDMCAKRTGADALRSAGHVSCRALSGAANALYRYENGLPFSNTATVSNLIIRQVVEQNPTLPESVTAITAVGNFIHSQATAAFCHYVLSGIDAEDSARFFTKLETGEDLKRGDPILALRGRFINDRYEQRETILLIFKAWNAFRDGRSITLLRLNDGESVPKPY